MQSCRSIKTDDEKIRQDQIIGDVVNILSRYLDPPTIYLFGSRTKGNNGKHADFDFAVDYFRPDISLQRVISEEIEAAAGLYKVDVVYLRSVDREFREIVIKTGKVIYEK